MFPPLRALLRLALYLMPLSLAGCPTDERGLAFGYSVSSGSSNGVTEAGASGGDASRAGGSGGDDGAASRPSGGAPDVDGSAGQGVAAAGAPAPGSAGSPQHGGSASGGVGAGAGTSNASAGSSGTGGGGVGGTGSTVDAGPCGDLDQNGVQDCDETVARNPRFDTSATDWLADPGVTQVWQAEDARGEASSGSLAITFTTPGGSKGWALAAAGQCLPAWGEDTYEVGARAQVASGQSGGQAELDVAFFGNDACLGSLLGSKALAPVTQTGVWQPLKGTVELPAGTRSVLLRLAAAKPGAQPSLEVHFDDVLFRKK